MKRARIIAFAALAVAMAGAPAARAQGRMAVAATYDYAWKHGQHGFGAKFQYRFLSHFRVEPELIYFTSGESTTTFDINLNVHYLFDIAERFTVYPTGGLNYGHWGYVGPDEDRIGVLLGGGAEYRVWRNLSILAEQRFQFVSHETQAFVTLGAKVDF